MRLLLLLLIFSLHSDAAEITNNQSVSIRVPVQTICGVETISATTPTEITGNTSSPLTTYGASAVQVFNINASSTLYCGSNSALTTSGSNMGVPIAPASSAPFYWLSWGISTMQGFYCLSSSGNISVLVCLVK